MFPMFAWNSELWNFSKMFCLTLSIVSDETNFCDVRFSYTRLCYGYGSRVCHCGHGSGCWGWHHQGGHDALVDYWANCHIHCCLLAIFLCQIGNKQISVPEHLLRDLPLLSTTKENNFNFLFKYAVVNLQSPLLYFNTHTEKFWITCDVIIFCSFLLEPLFPSRCTDESK